jgi:DNA-binding NarL/FixJ family response regulator
MIAAMGEIDRGPKAPIAVLLVDDDAMLRRGLRELLEEAGVRIAAEARSAAEAVARAAELTPDVVVMAVKLRGGSGIEAARRIARTAKRPPVLMLSGPADSAEAARAIRAGACGYVLSDDPPEAIVAAVRATATGESPLSPRVATGLLGKLRSGSPGDGAKPELSARERNVLELLAAGRRNTQIAAQLGISVHTVKRHASHVFEKLGVENRTQAAMEAARRGLVQR